ncbi:hypothetical protein Tco_1150020 [Tanacetum coccineum]
MANLPPPNDDLNIPEDEPVNLEPALVVPNPAPMQPKIVLNDVDEENLEEDLQENLEAEEELEDDDDDMNDVEVINPFEEANLLNQPPLDFEAEWRHVPTGHSTTQLLPTIHRPYEPTYAPADPNDPYVAARVVVVPVENDNDATAPRDPQPSESHGSRRDP